MPEDQAPKSVFISKAILEMHFELTINKTFMVLKWTFPLTSRTHKNPSSYMTLKIVNNVKKQEGSYSSCFVYHSQRSLIESVEVWILCVEVIFCSVMRSWRRQNGRSNNNTDWICLKCFTFKGTVLTILKRCFHRNTVLFWTLLQGINDWSSITVKLPEELLHSFLI